MRTNDIKSNSSKTWLQWVKMTKIDHFEVKMPIFGHSGAGVVYGFVTCNSSISMRHPFEPQY